MQGLTGLTLEDPEWLELLKAQVAQGRTITEVAMDIGMSRPSLSMLISGTYPARLDKVEAKYASVILSRFKDQVFCPHLHTGLPRVICARHAGAERPASAERMRHWRACQGCAQNPKIHVPETPKGKDQ
ncbi:helix-turn-helix transcriptional regulator [Puniceibacterium sp. IMCC21224]|uniref:helix-turn-helix domain-containing protein n=1 Tax=Puniceibacterium sp. IMCC21224 TaxID=1618204 RepID=UPI00065D3AB4|nr:helix-turn-helix transcriptional regulator [Puniceibacterium sp. IMCC21224]KMK68558.1 hypothetical protein IMCC21224_113441 [Puniceibacterium sp. IMCC21224]